MKKVRHRTHNIFDNEAEIKIKKFWKYRLSVSPIEWPIYQYRPQKKQYRSISASFGWGIHQMNLIDVKKTERVKSNK